MIPRRLSALLSVLALHSLSTLATAQQAAKPKPFDAANLDTTCAPCKDFFQFANGGWMKNNPIPPAYSSWGSFSELDERNRATLHTILDDAAAKAASAPAASSLRRLGVFYGSCLDSARAEADGATPIADELRRISAMQTPADVQAEIARLQQAGLNVLFRLSADQDLKNSTQVIAWVDQGGLGLPDRDYYTKTDSASLKLKADYQAHIKRTLILLGDPPTVADYQAGRIVALETALANASMTRVQRRDPKARDHKTSVADLKAMTPAFDWDAYLASSGIAAIGEVNVASPGYFKAVDSVSAKTTILDWRSYLRYHLVQDASPWLSTPFVNENFRFQQVLTGAKELFPRWRRCLDATDNQLGEALGQAYVEKTFTPAAKARALAMVTNMVAVLRDRLTGLEWMQQATRTQALAKLNAFARKIGYPDKWRDYSALDVKPGPFILNVLSAAQFDTRRDLAKIGKPVDRTEWGMTPPTVNAYYNPQMNEIVFPAGILQPPFFDPAADDALNYGGMGAVIGHEMTHGFDDQGRQYDGKGNLADWWTADDATKYLAQADKVVKQFDGYVIDVDSLHVNGKLTLGENIADLGGLKIAYAAMQRGMAGKPRPAKIDGFTPEQRFFLAWAQVWRRNIRPERARMLINVDSHSPSNWRTNGPLSNLQEFAKAFGCKAGDEMVRAEGERAVIW